MKTIERPESTTVIDELMFHEIRNVTEAENVFKEIKEENIFLYVQTVDEKTFQPKLFFMIKTGPFIKTWLKYVSILEYIGDKVKLGE